ncbi:hypothetical protein BDF19DRAFT_439443 [Syncephalis fuscata]|nr:hypothetical protein BDF19DRAFT_439443 [Syncephalis fuscata]
MSVNKSSNYIKETVKKANKYPNLALVMSASDFIKAGCKTKQQVNNAVKNITEQLESANFPPIKQFILSMFPSYVQWNFDFMTYSREELFKDLASSSSMRFAILDADENQLANDILYYAHVDYPYTIEEGNKI